MVLPWCYRGRAAELRRETGEDSIHDDVCRDDRRDCGVCGRVRTGYEPAVWGQPGGRPIERQGSEGARRAFSAALEERSESAVRLFLAIERV